MTDDTLQQLAEKYGFVLIAVERAKNMARDAYLAGEKAGLEQAARLCDTWQLFFPGSPEISEAGDEVADMLGVEIRKRKEE